MSRQEQEIARLRTTVNRLRAQAARQSTKMPVWLGYALRQQRLEVESPEGQAFVAGWINGNGRKSLQIPLLIEEHLRRFYIAGFMARSR